MATEIHENVPGHWEDRDPSSGTVLCITIRSDRSRDPGTIQCNNIYEHWNLEDESFRKIPDRLVWTTPVEDGAAPYLIRNEDPLIMVHIPYGDRHRADPALIRDLQPEEITRYRAWVKEINQELTLRKSQR